MKLTLIILVLAWATEVHAAATPVWFNSGMNNRDITFSPDGEVMLTTIVAPKQRGAVIAVSQKLNGTWSPLQVAPFSGRYMDIEPAFSPDGSSLYFASKRPKPDRDDEDWDLWRVSYHNGHWGEVEHLGNAVNTTGNEFYPSLTNDGTLYFTATREDTNGVEDLYRAEKDNQGRYRHVENIGPPVNTDAFEFNAFIAPDESYLIFGAQRRPEEIGGGDLYISYKQGDRFTEPILLPSTVNSPALDYCPTIWNGRFYFTTEKATEKATEQLSEAPIDTIDTIDKMESLYGSPGNGLGDIYWIDAADVLR